MLLLSQYRRCAAAVFTLAAVAFFELTLVGTDGLRAQVLATMNSTIATSSLTVITTSTGSLMIDPINDAQGGGNAQDFASYTAGSTVFMGAPNTQNANVTLTKDYPGFYIAAGNVGGADSLLFRATMTDQNGNKNYLGGYVGVGLDVGNGAGINLDGKIDLFALVDSTSPTGNASLMFKTAGTGANDGPSTTTVANYANQAAQNYTLTTNTSFSYAPSNSANYGASNSIAANSSKTINNYDVTFAVSWVQLTNAIAALGNINNTNFATFGNVGLSTQLQFFFFTSQNPNAFNQDIGGTLGNTTAAVSWANMGALSTTYSGDGSKPAIPEFGTVAQTGLILLVGGGLVLWRRRRAAVEVSARG